MKNERDYLLKTASSTWTVSSTFEESRRGRLVIWKATARRDSAEVTLSGAFSIEGRPTYADIEKRVGRCIESTLLKATEVAPRP
jgi:hypothetical protein